MKKDRYHHGYLKQTMIEEGINYINKHGAENLSLRKIASLCDVSHTAPYKHFKHKNDYINQIILYVTEKFTDTLTNIVGNYEDTTEIMTELGIEYVDFFSRNPNYFRILFFENQVNFGLVFSENEDSINPFPPYKIYKDASVNFLESLGIAHQECDDQILFMWSLVQGLASIFTLKGVKYTKDQKASIRRILGIKIYSADNNEQID